MAAAPCEPFGIPLSSHCAPALHVAACCCGARAVRPEWFHGLGLELREADAREYAP